MSKKNYISRIKFQITFVYIRTFLEGTRPNGNRQLFLTDNMESKNYILRIKSKITFFSTGYFLSNLGDFHQKNSHTFLEETRSNGKRQLFSTDNFE